MKKILYASLLGGILISHTACEDYNKEYLDEYSTILYFTKSGEVPLTIYKTGNNTDYKVNVYKAGSDHKASTDVEVQVISEANLAIYNELNGKSYQIIPSSCYEITNQPKLTFSGSQMNQTMNVTLKTDLIDELPPIEGTYVLPFELTNSKDSINSEKKYSFITPKVTIPTVYFTKTGYNRTTMNATGSEKVTLKLPISLPIDNQWEFDCTVALEEDLLKDYNEKNGTTFRMLPLDSYTMNSTVSFTSKDDIKEVEIVVDPTKLVYGDYVLPLQLISCSNENFLIDEENNTCLFGIAFNPAFDQLTKLNLTEDMVTSNAEEKGDGAGILGLVDNNPETFFHSNWSVKVYSSYGHYIEVDTKKEVGSIAFGYYTRHNNANGAPKKIVLHTSNDGVNFTKLAVITENLPTTAKAQYTSGVYSAGGSFRYVRISVMESASGKMDETNSAYFAMGDLFLWGL
ncbi:MAG: DUF1735 domain-containing protein [Bacteroidales bacterium]